MNLSYSLFACVVMFELCLASHFRHKNHDHSKYNKKSHDHTLHYGLVTMPSGYVQNVTKPYLCSCSKCGYHAKRVLLHPRGSFGHHEYDVVKKEVMGGSTPSSQVMITKIEKIINPCLWSRYWYRKQQVRVEASDEVNEMMLFHYAAASDNYVTDSGFDERYARMGDLGAGLYFTSNFTKAQENSKPKRNGTRILLLCRVTLGKSSEDSGQRAHAPIGFQSVKRQGAKDYVIYRGEQAYPEYLITYRI